MRWFQQQQLYSSVKFFLCALVFFGCTLAPVSVYANEQHRSQLIAKAQLRMGGKHKQLTQRPPAYPHAHQHAQPVSQLPNTGATPGMVAAIGGLLLCVGLGLRLRSMDPNHY